MARVAGLRPLAAAANLAAPGERPRTARFAGGGPLMAERAGDLADSIRALDPEAVGCVSVVIPAAGEAETMPELLRRVRAVLEPRAKEAEIVVVIPSPEDPTGRAAESGGARVLVQKRPGYGGALKEGLLAARGNYVITMDADLSHPPETIADLLLHRDDAEVVIASRYVEGGSAVIPPVRGVLSRILNFVYRRALAVPVLDMSSGFRIYQRRVLNELETEGETYDILEEILVKIYSLGWAVAEIPFGYRPRAAGESHASVVGFTPHFLVTLFRLWRMRKLSAAADFDSRAFDSVLPPQRFWQRRRFRIINEFAVDRAPRLDVGCGSSRLIQWNPASIGLDLAIGKLRFLRATNPLLVRGTAFRLPFADGAFRCVVISKVIELLPPDPGLFLELNRVLEPGGVLVVATPDYARVQWRAAEGLYRWLLPAAYGDRVVTRFTRHTLTEALAGAGFAILEHRYIFGSELIMKCAKREERALSEEPGARLPAAPAPQRGDGGGASRGRSTARKPGGGLSRPRRSRRRPSGAK